MKLKPVNDPAFARYGVVLDELDLRGLAKALRAHTPLPEKGTVYEPGCEALEAEPVANMLRDRLYGGMPIQIGYCNGPGKEGFRVAIALPKGTNTAPPDLAPMGREDNPLRARNKWLLAHPDAPEASDGAHVGLTGINITV